MRHARWACLFYVSFIKWCLCTKPTTWMLIFSSTFLFGRPFGRVLHLMLMKDTRAGPAKKRIKGFLKPNLVNHCKVGLQNWTHWPWRNSAYAGPKRSRIGLELAEISNKTQNYLFLVTFVAYLVQICMAESDSNSPRYPTKLKITHFWWHFWPTNLYDRSKNRRSRARWKMV